MICVQKQAWYFFNSLRNMARRRFLSFLTYSGNIVRISPNEVYYSSPNAYRAIYAQIPSLIKGPYYNQFNSIEGVGNLFTEQSRDQHHHYKSTFSSLFSRRNIAKMEDMIRSKCDMLRGHLWRKVDTGENVDILAAVRSLATDVISTAPLFFLTCLEFELINSGIGVWE